jgi:TRAP-type C4-dicarboxylate transport system permease small subunit
MMVSWFNFESQLIRLKSWGYFRRNEMGLVKIVAIVLILAGSLGLVYGGFSYTKDTQEAKIGPLELSVKETKTVNVPVWAGVAAIVAGGGLLLFSSKRS